MQVCELISKILVILQFRQNIDVYRLSFSDDRAVIKCLGIQNHSIHIIQTPLKIPPVYGVFLLETVQTALTGADLYYWFASGFGNMVHLTNPYLSAFDTPMLGSIIALIVQGFFCYRIWRFNKSAWWVSGLIGCVSVHKLDYVDIC